MNIQIPTFLDFEASSLHTGSYPIQVAWNIGEEYTEYLIRPHKSWTDWDYNAQNIHGIAQNDLLTYGKDAKSIALVMNEALREQLVLSDNPAYEKYWRDRLFAQYDIHPEFEFADIRFNLPVEIVSRPHLIAQLENWRKQARIKAGPAHQAKNDVAC